MTNKKLKLAIVAHRAIGEFINTGNRHAGGVERQTSIIANWLTEKGIDVSVITWREGDQRNETVNGVRIIKLCRESDGIPVIRFFYPRWSSLVRALKEADADIYYHNTCEGVTGQIALWCKSHNKKFIYSASSDYDCYKDLPFLDSRKDKILYRYGITRADRVFVQTDTQKKLLADNFNISSVVLAMPGETSSQTADSIVDKVAHTKFNVIWIGRIDQIKRPELIIELAKMLPEIEFNIAGKPLNRSTYSDNIISSMESLPNVSYHGMLNREELGILFKRASVLCNTSTIEGFPNTFLEAWSYGIPVITFFDPDSVICNNGLGVVCDEFDEMHKTLAHIFTDQDSLLKLSMTSYQYYLKNHDSSSSMQRYLEEILKVCS